MKKLLSKFSPAKGFIQHQLRRSGAGFTLIELLVVIAIIGVLAAVLAAILDPLDKIRAANDAGVISTVGQLGKGNDGFAVNNSNQYVVATTFAGAVTALNTAGESKFGSITSPAGGYTYAYIAPAGCAAATPANCTSYVFSINLQSKKYTSTPFYWFANGKGCIKAAAPLASTDTCP